MIIKINFLLRMVVYIKVLSIAICILIISLFPFGKTYAQEFEIREISDKVFIVSGSDLGEI